MAHGGASLKRVASLPCTMSLILPTCCSLDPSTTTSCPDASTGPHIATTSAAGTAPLPRATKRYCKSCGLQITCQVPRRHLLSVASHWQGIYCWPRASRQRPSPLTLTCSLVRALERASPAWILAPSAAPAPAAAVKSPHSGAETPWHQDAGYWPFLPDTRAVSVWCAIDPATVNSGCMWFARPAPLARHTSMTDGGHALTAVLPRDGLPEPEMPPGCVPPRLPRADAAGPVFSCAQGAPAPLEPGGATLHGGFTPHYTCGNSTRFPRRAYIMNFRPAGESRGSKSAGVARVANRP